MTQPPRIAALLLAASLLLAGCRCGAPRLPASEFGYKVAQDHCNYYSPENVGCLAVGFGVGATLAHTDVDQELRDSYQQHARSASSDDLARAAKVFGEGEYLIAAAGAAWALGAVCDETAVGAATGDWGERSFRALLVGSPPLLLAQSATGGSRPAESSADSDWVPFHDDNGVSGHSFIGAVPFITAAQMSESPWLTTTLYAASAAPAWSRINDDMHYTSQAVLGWWMAYLACRSVDGTERQQCWYEPEPIVTADGTLGVGWTFER